MFRILDVCLEIDVGCFVWLSGRIVGRVNKVTVRRARLVLGWVTVCRRNRPRQLSLAIPPWVDALDTSESWE